MEVVEIVEEVEKVEIVEIVEIATRLAVLRCWVAHNRCTGRFLPRSPPGPPVVARGDAVGVHGQSGAPDGPRRRSRSRPKIRVSWREKDGRRLIVPV